MEVFLHHMRFTTWAIACSNTRPIFSNHFIACKVLQLESRKLQWLQVTLLLNLNCFMKNLNSKILKLLSKLGKFISACEKQFKAFAHVTKSPEVSQSISSMSKIVIGMRILHSSKCFSFLGRIRWIQLGLI